MTDYPTIVLRYFDVRGRAQFIRGLLSHRRVPYADERIDIGGDPAVWRTKLREDRSISGPFQKLPTLQWGDHMIGEVLAITGFLQRRLGDADVLDEEEELRHAMLSSSAFLDLLTPCINLIWSDIFNPGVDVAGAAGVVKGRLAMHLATVNRTLDEWQWLTGISNRPVMAADAILWEALDVIRLTFGGDISLEEHDTLARFHAECPGRGTFEALLAANPATITARPGEAEALDAIRADA